MEHGGSKYHQIGELANLVNMSPRTIRYYEEIGLLNSVKRIEGGKRVYTERDIQRLRFIARLKHLGLTLSEMSELEDIYQIHRTNRKVLPRLLELLDNHVLKIDERINQLVKLKADVLEYKTKVCQKLNVEDDSKKGVDSDERRSDYERRPNSHR
jgi:MerR family transcriptional regulator, repressor of the yfmOP operon